jgi:hypothetical protein
MITPSRKTLFQKIKFMVIECAWVAADGNQVRLSYLGRVYRAWPGAF